jgi:hypothetical protein
MHGLVVVDLALKYIRALLILQAIVALPASGESIPIELFTREDELRNLKLSPDGQFVAAVAGNRSEAWLSST